MRVLGIDPGKDGAFAIVNDAHLELVETFPKVGPDKPESEISFKELHKRLLKLNVGIDLIFIERLSAIYGSSAKSTFNFGRNYQIALSVAELLYLPTELIKPIDWQRAMFKGETPQYKISKDGKKNKKDTKAMALKVAHRLFPNEDFQRTQRTTKPHDGMVDAALIAYWGANLKWRK